MHRLLLPRRSIVKDIDVMLRYSTTAAVIYICLSWVAGGLAVCGIAYGVTAARPVLAAICLICFALLFVLDWWGMKRI